MSADNELYPGRRISYDKALCTVRSVIEHIPGTTGKWLGVEWDDTSRGKHDGTYNGIKYFQCRSNAQTVASFVRPTRKTELEQTVYEAIKLKYVTDPSSNDHDVVVISGKVAEEVGFDKVSRQQSSLFNLKIAVLDRMVISGIAPKNSALRVINQAQKDLAAACPNVIELDISDNPIETWSDVEDICSALPKLRIIKLNIRFRELLSNVQSSSRTCFQNLRELHLNGCLIRPAEIAQLLRASNGSIFPSLQSLWLSQNELSNLMLPEQSSSQTYESIASVVLDGNYLQSLTAIEPLLSIFPNLSHISLQSNEVSWSGAWSGRPFPTIKSLDLSKNKITSWSSVDVLPQMFPNFSSLRISGNPIYDTSQPPNTLGNPTDSLYYLTLARIPKLKILNHSNITSREREEGEIYYLSVAEKEIRSRLTQIDSNPPSNVTTVATKLRQQFPNYDPLCEKHDRDNLITHLTDTLTSTDSTRSTAVQPSTQTIHPPGSLASRLVDAKFYLANSNPPKSFTRHFPNTVPTSTIFALVSRELDLPALRFKLVYESDELDPVRAEFTTRSRIYADRESGEKRWDEWADWDADALVERALTKDNNENDGEEDGVNAEGRWTEDGVLIRDGRRWKRREVEVLFGTRAWGDWLEKDAKSCKIRVVPVDGNRCS